MKKLVLIALLFLTLTSCKGVEEEKITLYTSQPESDYQVLIEAFNEVYPEIKVEVFRSGTEEVTSKLLAEKEVGNIVADVVLLADSVTFEKLKENEMLEPYESENITGISEEYIDVDGMYTGTKLITTGIAINTEYNKEEITLLKDLTKESLKNEVIMPSPLYSGAAAYNLGVLLNTENFGKKYYTDLKENETKVGTGNGSVLNSLLTGDKTVGLLVDYMAIREKNKGSNIDFIYPKEGSLLVTEPIGIMKSSENMDNSKKFVDFVLSDEGQTLASSLGYTPIKDGIEAPSGMKNSSEIKNLSYDINVLIENKETDKTWFASIFD